MKFCHDPDACPECSKRSPRERAVVKWTREEVRHQLTAHAQRWVRENVGVRHKDGTAPSEEDLAAHREMIAELCVSFALREIDTIGRVMSLGADLLSDPKAKIPE